MAAVDMSDIKIILSNLEFGVLFATLLFGTIMVQTYHVLISESKSQGWLKPLVSAIL
jgi:hypothetical protein